MPWAVVTGGSRGISAASCVALAADGFDIAFAWWANDVAAGAVVRRIEGMGRKAVAARVDLGDLSAVGAWARTVADELRPQVLVANAGETFRVEAVRWLAPALAATGVGAEPLADPDTVTAVERLGRWRLSTVDWTGCM